MKIAVIGGGPAGLIAAAIAAQNKNHTVNLFERNEKVGKKLYITGKGRCNVTNAVPAKDFLENVISNEKFLFSAINRFTPFDTVELLNAQGIQTKVERGNRVFPTSDKASDVTKALTQFALKNGVVIKTNILVESVKHENNQFYVKSCDGADIFDTVILACGGKSYSSTGSDGVGYALAKSMGHSIIPLMPALVPIKLKEDVSSLQGLSLKNVSATITSKQNSISRFGEMLFTKDGVSGPIILTLSSLINRWDLTRCKLSIDLKPKLSEEVLDKRILSDFEKYSNKQCKNALFDLLPSSLIPYILKLSQLDENKPVHFVTKNERTQLVKLIKELPFTVSGLYDLECAVVTAGGVDVTQINPKTMQSKLTEGLYIVGEMLDTDALTGGFNIQIALSTGYAAGQALKEKDHE